jgi:hypothetical protein
MIGTAHRIGVWLAATVLALATLSGGGQYVFCSMMGEVVSRPCCDLRVAPRDDGAPEIASRDSCCSIHRIAAVPASAPPASYVRLSSPPAPTNPLAFAFAAPSPSSRVVAPPFERLPTGPPKPSDLLRRICVFLI